MKVMCFEWVWIGAVIVLVALPLQLYVGWCGGYFAGSRSWAGVFNTVIPPVALILLGATPPAEEYTVLGTCPRLVYFTVAVNLTSTYSHNLRQTALGQSLERTYHTFTWS